MKRTAQEKKEKMTAALEDYITSHKMRRTPERFALLEQVAKKRFFFTVDELWEEIREEYRVSRATVYNTLELLCECMVLRKIFMGPHHVAYEHALDNHLHLICTDCGKVKEVTASQKLSEEMVAKFRGFRPMFSSITVYGLCTKCRKTKYKSHGKNKTIQRSETSKRTC